VATATTLKAALRDHSRALYGMWLGLTDPAATEIAVGAGFDWVCFDGEHAPNDIRTTLAHLQMAAAYPVHAVVRPPVAATHLVKQYLDIGATALVIPMIESVAQAREMVAAVRYPPRGVRGVGTAVARAARWTRTTDYLERADDDIALILQVESPTGLSIIDGICAEDGVDAVFIGPADLAATMGHRGQPGHPDVVAAIEDAIRRIVAGGKAAGILVGDDASARRYSALGATFVGVGVDTVLLARATSELASRFRNPTV
jgi:4-hydroxy-2-oxoheptanedioate aldolase